MIIDPELIILVIEAVQREEYPEDKEWFYQIQTVIQLIELLEDKAEGGEMIE